MAGAAAFLKTSNTEQGLLEPARLPSGHREYEEADIVTVRGIRMLLAAGLNTAAIAELLPCIVDAGRILEPACSSMLPDLNRERARIDEAVADLLAARVRLDTPLRVPLQRDPARRQGRGMLDPGRERQRRAPCSPRAAEADHHAVRRAGPGGARDSGHDDDGPRTAGTPPAAPRAATRLGAGPTTSAPGGPCRLFFGGPLTAPARTPVSQPVKPSSSPPTPPSCCGARCWRR